MLSQLDNDNLTFPPLNLALTDPNGLLAIGGDLSVERLKTAYRKGIFPWYSEHDPLMWWSPNPRAIIPIDQLRVNRTLRKAINKAPYRITLNKQFAQVIDFCADAPFRQDGTWIVDDMQAAYIALHQKGYAHSIEVWQDHQPDNGQAYSELVGGLYGVAINGFFSGESMFYTQANASKFALVALARILKSINVQFIDCQLLNPFLEDMGAIEIGRAKFITLKESAIAISVPSDFWQPSDILLT
jgi:leucyl/phenylalanyl-tRNA--protein transferase